MPHVRHAAVAGMFYSENPRELEGDVRRYLAEVPPLGSSDPPPKAIIAPHAGYIYSGAVAARAYARLVPVAERIRRVVVLGPCHRVPVRGLAVSGADAFETPLGSVPVDAEARDAILALPQVTVFDDTHAQEHSLEVHLPFLQEIFSDFTIVPIVVGQASGAQVAEVMERLWGGGETVFVISSDLSHFLDYDSARAMDAETCRAIETLNPEPIGHEQACGRIPVAGMLTLAKRRGLDVATLDLRNSGDTAGDRRRVVGYGAWVFTEPRRDDHRPSSNTGGAQTGFAAKTQALLDRHGTTVLRLAADSIDHGLANGEPPPIDLGAVPRELQANGACFVTLTRDGRLRGCVGSPTAHRPLAEDVFDNAFAAAFRDRRFKPLTAGERDRLAVSVSVLSPPEAMLFAGEDHLLEQLRPGADGLIIECQGRRALFLPAVWESLPKPAVFLRQLKAKAGLAPNHWSGDFRAWRFATVAVASPSLDAARPSGS